MKKMIQGGAAAAALFANDSRILPDRADNIRPGAVLFSNDARFLGTYFSEPLTNYAVGWKDPNDIDATLEFLAPAVTVPRRFEWKKAANAEEFLSEVVDDQRAIGSDFKRVEYTQSDVTDKTINKGLTYIMDLDNVTPGDTAWQNKITAKLLRRLKRNDLRRAYTVLAAAATNTAVTWSTGTSANPDKDLRNDLLTATTATGIRPNRIVFGDSAWNNRRTGFEAATSTTTSYANAAAMTPEVLAANLMVDKILVSKERYQTASATKSEVVGNIVLGFFAEEGVDTEDASNIKRFVSTFDGEQGGGLYRVFVQQISAKLVALTVEQYSKIVVTYTGGIRKWTVS